MILARKFRATLALVAALWIFVKTASASPRATEVLAVVAGGSSIVSWQEQLDWGLRIVATLVAIGAGAVTLYQRLKKRPDAA